MPSVALTAYYGKVLVYCDRAYEEFVSGRVRGGADRRSGLRTGIEGRANTNEVLVIRAGETTIGTAFERIASSLSERTPP
ncbi:MAG: hypothetical protein OXF02_08180 [Simkaniaceae bacterium]|nr:hypothetical protein [Simkaniaceae bacterium]